MLFLMKTKLFFYRAAGKLPVIFMAARNKKNVNLSKYFLII